ncbi:MAG: anaerobic C4-dicarboxylate transporter [Lautropia sp.]|nr:anaerobic C4-dicarboxylate transporter [Lautropia sp.]
MDALLSQAGIHPFWAQLALLLVIIYFGIRYGGVALGLLGGFGITVLAFLFGVAPGKPPIDVILIILAVVTTSATLEATGALNLIVRLAETLLRRHPERVTYLAPVCTFTLTMLVGTGHAVYPLLPVIYDVAYSKGIRPERPMAVASVASQMGITASPVSAALATVVAIAATNHVDVSVPQVLAVTVPSCLIGMLVAATWSLRRGKDLADDPEFQEKMKDPAMREYIEGGAASVLNEVVSVQAKRALAVFLLGIVTIVFLASAGKDLLPLDEKGKALTMVPVIQFIMLAAGAIILFITGVKPKSISDSKVFNAGMVAVVMILGIAWMSDTVISGNKGYITDLLKAQVEAYPWTFALAMFVFSAFLKSQAATLTVMLPLGFALGLSPATLLGSIPACYAYFFFCFYPSDLATINFDRTGTTRIGKYILNHSFMIPGLIGVGVATTLAMFIARMVV